MDDEAVKVLQASLLALMRDGRHLQVDANDVSALEESRRLDHQIALEGPTRLRVVRLHDESCPCPVANSLRQDTIGPVPGPTASLMR